MILCGYCPTSADAHTPTLQVSDIKFHAFGQERAYAFASLGCEGQAGGVSARRCMPAEGAVRQVRNTMALRRQRTDVQVCRGCLIARHDLFASVVGV